MRLKDLNPYEFFKILEEKFGDNIILLCHELPGLNLNKEHFYHRILISNWIELETGIIIPEISIDKNGNEKREEIYDLKPKIKKLIKNTINKIKKNFNCLENSCFLERSRG